MLTAVRRTGRRMGRVGKQLQMGEEKGPIEDEMVGWHHRLNGHEFE